MRLRRIDPAVRGLALIAIAGVTALLIACGAPAGTPTGSPSQVAPSQGASSPVPASTSATPADVVATFPPSQVAIEPGTYRWDGFARSISITLGSGWALGHDDAAFFDLFRGSDFPAVSFARFTDVYADATTRSEATDSATVAATLGSRRDMTVTEPTTIDLGGLPGRQFDLTTTAPKTALFFGPAGDFRLDPEFKTRYRVLDFPGGGVLVIGIHAHEDEFDAAVALAEPLTSTLQVEPTNP
jgi:hypothetical protein